MSEQITLIENLIIGKTIEEAVSVAAIQGLSVRVMKQDGREYMGTCDLRSDRINVAVVDGKVALVLSIG